MLLTMIFEIHDKTARWVSNCAIERVVNQTLEILESSDHGYASVNQSDWKASKSVVVDLWVRLQDAIFRKANGVKDQKAELLELEISKLDFGKSEISKSENPISEIGKPFAKIHELLGELTSPEGRQFLHSLPRDQLEARIQHVASTVEKLCYETLLKTANLTYCVEKKII